MKINKHEKMWEYLMQYPEMYQYLKFNTVDSVPGETSVSTSYSESWEKKYYRGHGIKRYDFAVILIRQFDTGTSNVNIYEIFDVQKFMEWIEEQNRIRNFPDFGIDTEILSIENLQNMPNLAGIDNDAAAAKYMFQCRVRYYE